MIGIKRIYKIIAGNVKLIASVSALALIALTVGYFSYQYAENVISYEFEKSVIKNNTETTDTNYNGDIEQIPYSDSYTLKLLSGTITVYDADNITVYRQTNTDVSLFTEQDIIKLEQDGIKFTARSDLIETLNYICS